MCCAALSYRFVRLTYNHQSILGSSNLCLCLSVKCLTMSGRSIFARRQYVQRFSTSFSLPNFTPDLFSPQAKIRVFSMPTYEHRETGGASHCLDGGAHGAGWFPEYQLSSSTVIARQFLRSPTRRCKTCCTRQAPSRCDGSVILLRQNHRTLPRA